MPKPIIFWGATGQAKVLAEFIESVGYKLVALFDNDAGTEPPLPGVPLLIGVEGFMRWRSEQQSDELYGLVAIGGSRGRDRCELQSFLEENGVKPVVAVHPSAAVATNAMIAEGSQVLAGSVVAAQAVLGRACIVNTAASVDHECSLARGVHIGPGAVLCGCVAVGQFSFIGAGAVVLPRLNIGHNVVIGAGAVVTKDIPDDCVAYGNPARIKSELRKRM
jgi:sugar O-acyltransferase (sialic acid O-acetyltransferase NeuD family)